MQRTLPLSRDERLLWIEAARLPVSRTRARRIKTLLYHLETSTGADGCFPFQDTLAAKMGVTEKTIYNYTQAAAELNLVNTSARITSAGKRGLVYHVNWSSLGQFCSDEDLASIAAATAAPDPSRASKQVKQQLRKVSGRSRKFPVATGNGFWSGPETVSGPPILIHSKPPPTKAEAAKVASEEWAAIESEVFGLGVEQAESAVAAAITAGCTVAEIRGLIAEHRSQAGAGPGLLFVRLMRMRPGRVSKPVKGPKSQESARQQWLTAAAVGIDQAEQLRQEKAAEEQRLAELERLHGSQLDQLADEERAALCAAVFARAAGLQAIYRRNPSSRIVRAELLREMQKSQGRSQNESRELV